MERIPFEEFVTKWLKDGSCWCKCPKCGARFKVVPEFPLLNCPECMVKVERGESG